MSARWWEALGPNVRRAYARALKHGPLKPSLAPHLTPGDRFAECVRCCDATPQEAAQAALDLAHALQRAQDAQTELLLKESDGPHPHD